MLLMEEILHHLVGSLFHYLQGFLHPRWLFGIFSIKSIAQVFVACVVFFLLGGKKCNSCKWHLVRHVLFFCNDGVMMI